MKSFRKIVVIASVFLPVAITSCVYADTAGVSQVESFIKNLITAVASLSGLVATAFIVVGGFRYITSSGNPQHLERAKRTLIYSATGLAITIAAFVLSNIVTNLANSAFGS
jgi:TRAP-type C4-dicarboxylate transport system permease small subunit